MKEERDHSLQMKDIGKENQRKCRNNIEVRETFYSESLENTILFKTEMGADNRRKYFTKITR